MDPYLLRQVPVRGELTRRNAAACINRLLILAAEDGAAPILVEVRSPGGSPAESLALIKTMNGIGCPIATFCREAVGSSAVVVAHGRRGCRAATSDARLFFAPASSPGKGRPQDLSSLQTLAEILAQDTGRSAAETLRWLQQGAQFSAQEALRMGLIDAISPKPILPEMPSP